MQIKLITEYKKGQKFKMSEEKLKERFGRNHGMNCDDIIKFVEVYSDNRGTGHFETTDGKIITLKVSDVIKINK